MVPIIECLHQHDSLIIHGDVWPSSFFTKPESRTIKLGGDEKSMPITNGTPEFLFGNVGVSTLFPPRRSGHTSNAKRPRRSSKS
jgi:hypothetical protein